MKKDVQSVLVVVFTGKPPSKARQTLVTTFLDASRELGASEWHVTLLVHVLSGGCSTVQAEFWRYPTSVSSPLSSHGPEVVETLEEEFGYLELLGPGLRSFGLVEYSTAIDNRLPETAMNQRDCLNKHLRYAVSGSSAWERVELVLLYTGDTGRVASQIASRTLEHRQALTPVGLLFWKSRFDCPLDILSCNKNYSDSFFCIFLACFAAKLRAMTDRRAAFVDAFSTAKIDYVLKRLKSPNGIHQPKVFLLDPDEESSLKPTYVGIPAIIWVSPEQESLALTRTQKDISLFFEVYRRKLFHAAFEVHQWFGDFQRKSEEFQLKGEEEYWRVATMYQVAVLFGWLTLIRETFRDGLKPIGDAVCPEEVFDQVELCFSDAPGGGSLLLSVIGKQMAKESLGAFRLRPTVLSYIKFKRSLTNPDREPSFGGLLAWYEQNKNNATLAARLQSVTRMIDRQLPL